MPPIPEKNILEFRTTGFFPDLDEDLNEALLFHTPSQDFGAIDGIRNNGFDPRCCSVDQYAGDLRVGGMFGAGCYFSEEITKSDQYADPKLDNYYFFLVKVCLGNPYFTDQPFTNKLKPPAHKGSVVGLVDLKKPGYPPITRFREFVVYDVKHAYPQYLVEVRRFKSLEPRLRPQILLPQFTPETVSQVMDWLRDLRADRKSTSGLRAASKALRLHLEGLFTELENYLQNCTLSPISVQENHNRYQILEAACKNHRFLRHFVDIHEKFEQFNTLCFGLLDEAFKKISNTTLDDLTQGPFNTISRIESLCYSFKNYVIDQLKTDLLARFDPIELEIKSKGPLSKLSLNQLKRSRWLDKYLGGAVANLQERFDLALDQKLRSQAATIKSSCNLQNYPDALEEWKNFSVSSDWESVDLWSNLHLEIVEYVRNHIAEILQKHRSQISTLDKLDDSLKTLNAITPLCREFDRGPEVCGVIALITDHWVQKCNGWIMAITQDKAFQVDNYLQWLNHLSNLDRLEHLPQRFGGLYQLAQESCQAQIDQRILQQSETGDFRSLEPAHCLDSHLHYQVSKKIRSAIAAHQAQTRITISEIQTLLALEPPDFGQCASRLRELQPEDIRYEKSVCAILSKIKIKNDAKEAEIPLSHPLDKTTLPLVEQHLKMLFLCRTLLSEFIPEVLDIEASFWKKVDCSWKEKIAAETAGRGSQEKLDFAQHLIFACHHLRPRSLVQTEQALDVFHGRVLSFQCSSLRDEILVTVELPKAESLYSQLESMKSRFTEHHLLSIIEQELKTCFSHVSELQEQVFQSSLDRWDLARTHASIRSSPLHTVETRKKRLLEATSLLFGCLKGNSPKHLIKSCSDLGRLLEIDNTYPGLLREHQTKIQQQQKNLQDSFVMDLTEAERAGPRKQSLGANIARLLIFKFYSSKIPFMRDEDGLRIETLIQAFLKNLAIVNSALERNEVTTLGEVLSKTGSLDRDVEILKDFFLTHQELDVLEFGLCFEVLKKSVLQCAYAFQRDLSAMRSPNGDSLLSIVLQQPEVGVTVVQSLVTRGLSVNHRNNANESPLHLLLASKIPHYQKSPVLEFLLAQPGLDVNCVSKESHH